MQNNIAPLDDWSERQKLYGNTPKAVLCKRLPNFINRSLHHQHTRFVLDMLPSNVHLVLDVGAGYGRIAAEIKCRFPAVVVEGVEACKPFAEEFAGIYGTCFAGPVQEYVPTSKYDAIVIVTLLMYLNPSDRTTVLASLYSALRKGGRLIIIEPSREHYQRLAPSMRRFGLSSRSSNACYFTIKEATSFFEVRVARLIAFKKIYLLSQIRLGAIHYATAWEKRVI